MSISRFLAAFALCAAPLYASAAELPEPRALIDRHAQAVGGVEAMRASNTASAKMSMEIAENGMRGDVRMHLRSDAMVVSMSLGGMQVSMGSSDGVSWMIDPMHGPRLLEGRERDNLLEEISPDYLSYADSAIASMKTTALSDSEGRPCYRVEIVWKSGSETMSCFGVEDGLLLAQESASIGPMGETRELFHMYDYKRLGGLMQPSRMRMKVDGATMIMTVETYDSGNPPDEVFTLPPAIVALIEDNKKREATPVDGKPAANATQAQ